MDDSSGWTSLEIVKLVVDVLTPLTVALVGVGLARVSRRVEASQWVNQKLIEKRIELLGQALPALNDQYCYFVWVGPWKELSPPEILNQKRNLDRLFHANRSFFSADTLVDYERFSSALFQTYTGPGLDARLRTGPVSRHGDREQNYPGQWDAGWMAMFATEDVHTPWDLVKERYNALMDRLGTEIGVSVSRDGENL